VNNPIPEEAAEAACTCYPTDPKTWTRYGDAVEPGSTMEPDPDCPEHFPQTITSVRDLLGIAPDWTDGMSTVDWVRAQRDRS
jgi:hypothetical protein